MRPPITSHERRAGFTLLELASAITITATLAASSVVVVRTAHKAWQRHGDDQQVRSQVVAALQHMMRRIRQAAKITDVSDPTDPSGELSVQNPDGTSASWSHNPTTDSVEFVANGAADVLATRVAAMTLTGLRVDGAQTTSQSELVHGVRCTLAYETDRPAGPALETVSCQAWIRSW